MQVDTPKLIARFSSRFFSGTVCSRASGFLRDVALSFAFGAGAELAAFLVAFRFANLFRRLLGESALGGSFIPFFEEIRKESPEKGALFLRDLGFSLFVLLIGFLLVGEGLLFGALPLLSEGGAAIARLMMPMLPGIAFVCLYALSGSFLQCERHFFLPAFAPSLFNATWAAGALFLGFLPIQTAIYGLSWATSLAFCAQWLVVFPLSYRLFRAQVPKGSSRACLFPPEVRRMIRPFGYGLFGIGAVQINSALDALFARYAALEGPAYLWYAIRVQQLPLALVTIAFTSALLPSLSRAFEGGNEKQFATLFSKSVARCLLFLIPCSIVMLILAPSGLNLLYGRGAFTSHDVGETALCLCSYAIGLVPYSLALLFTTLFHSRKEYRIPMIASVSSVIANILLNALFVFAFHLGAKSIAIATSLASVVQLLYLWGHARFLREERAALYRTGRVFALSLLAGLGALFLFEIAGGDPLLGLLFGREVVLPSSLLAQGGLFLAQSLLFGLLLLGGASLFKVDEVTTLFARK